MNTISVCVSCGEKLKESEFLRQQLDYCRNSECPRYGLWTGVSQLMYRCFDCNNYHAGYGGTCPDSESKPTPDLVNVRGKKDTKSDITETPRDKRSYISDCHGAEVYVDSTATEVLYRCNKCNQLCDFRVVY